MNEATKGNLGRVLIGTSLHFLLMSLFFLLGAPVGVLALTPLFALGSFIGVELINPAVIPAIRSRLQRRPGGCRRLKSPCPFRDTESPADRAAWAWVWADGRQCLHEDLGAIDRHVYELPARDLEGSVVVQLSSGLGMLASEYEAVTRSGARVQDEPNVTMARLGVVTTNELRTHHHRRGFRRPNPLEYDRRIEEAESYARPSGFITVDRKILESDMERLRRDFEVASGRGYEILGPPSQRYLL